MTHPTSDSGTQVNDLVREVDLLENQNAPAEALGGEPLPAPVPIPVPVTVPVPVPVPVTGARGARRYNKRPRPDPTRPTRPRFILLRPM